MELREGLEPMWILIFALCLIIFPSSVRGATYYVNNSGSPACSDSSGQNGSSSAPWCSLKYALGRIAGGDTLYLRNGTYNELTYGIYGPSGSSGRPTVIAANPGDTAVVLRGPDFWSGSFHLVNASFMKLTGFRMTNANFGLWIDGCHDITATDLTIDNVGQQGVFIAGNSTNTLTYNVTVSGSIIHDTGKNGGNGEGLYVGTHQNPPEPYVDNSHHVSILNNTLYNVTGSGIQVKAGTHDIIVDGNTVHDSTNKGSVPGGGLNIGDWTVGNQQYSGSANMTVRNNIVYNWARGDTNPNSALLHVAVGGQYYNNVLYGAGSGCYGIYVDNASNDTQSRNVYHNTVDPTGGATAYTNADTRGTVDAKNDIGPTGTNNLAFSSSYFVDAARHDYHLVSSAAVGAGANLLSTVPADIEGQTRTHPSDVGAYKFGGGGGSGGGGTSVSMDQKLSAACTNGCTSLPAITVNNAPAGALMIVSTFWCADANCATSYSGGGPVVTDGGDVFTPRQNVAAVCSLSTADGKIGTGGKLTVNVSFGATTVYYAYASVTTWLNVGAYDTGGIRYDSNTGLSSEAVTTVGNLAQSGEFIYAAATSLNSSLTVPTGYTLLNAIGPTKQVDAWTTAGTGGSPLKVTWTLATPSAISLDVLAYAVASTRQ
jgi:parallel beta-helix repeat protein